MILPAQPAPNTALFRSDPGALAAALIHLLGDPDVADRMGRAGRAWLLENATFDVMASRYLDLYASGTG